MQHNAHVHMVERRTSFATEELWRVDIRFGVKAAGSLKIIINNSKITVTVITVKVKSVCERVTFS